MTTTARRLTLGVALALGMGATAQASTPLRNDSITIQEVQAAQQAWGAALVRIATAHREGGVERARAVAGEVLDAAYGYASGPVLFKPTLTVAPQTFRTTREGALAYFVGGNPAFPRDNGFALNGWQRVEIVNSAVVIQGRTALTQGNVRLTDGRGQVVTVDKTWGFVRDDAGALRIVLHHSSLPHSP